PRSLWRAIRSNAHQYRSLGERAKRPSQVLAQGIRPSRRGFGRREDSAATGVKGVCDEDDDLALRRDDVDLFCCLRQRAGLRSATARKRRRQIFTGGSQETLEVPG